MTYNDLLTNIKIFEGFRSKKYVDVAGVPTIGYGFTLSCFPNEVPETMTKEEADLLLDKKVSDLLIKVKTKLLKFGYNPNELLILEFPLTDFAYNCGIGNIDKLTNNGKRNIEEIKEKIVLYNKAGGKTLPGLTKRRLIEKEWIEANEKEIGKVTFINPSAKDIQKLLNTKYGYNLEIDGILGKKSLKAIYDTLNI